MASLKRSLDRDPLAASISNKVYVRSTKSGKVQKIVREVYLRRDIPCSSKLCQSCLKGAPRDASGRRKFVKFFFLHPPTYSQAGHATFCMSVAN